MHANACSIFATLALAGTCVSAAAQTTGAAVFEGPYGKIMVTAQSAAPVLSAGTGDAALVTIYDSLAEKYPKGRYWCCTGYNVMGPQQGEQWMGAAFTPGGNHTVTRIEVAAGWSQGPNGIVISLDKDNGGVPGTALKTWKVANLPLFGTCCTLVVKSDRAGIPVSAGQQYWIVLSTDAKESNTVDGWNVSDADQIDNGSFATWSGGTWHTFQTAPGLAFAVKGSN